MAGKRGGDLLSSNGENEENRNPPGLALENAEETSDVSASLFKEISSEEEMEVLSGIPHRAGVDESMLGINEGVNADSDAESEEDGSLFEEIGGDDSHFGGLGGVQQSVYDRTVTRENGAGYILGGGIRFQTEDVPFIRAVRGDLDGPLDGPLASLRREDGVSLHTFGENLNSILEGLRAKDEPSPLAGICRDYGSASSGEEGGEYGVSAAVPDPHSEGIRVPSPVSRQESNVEHIDESVQVLMISMEHENDVDVVSGIISGDQPEFSIPPLTIEGTIEGHALLDPGDLADGGVMKVLSTPSPEAPKKRGRASRELGALLVDANGGGRRRKAAGLPAGGISDEFAFAVVRGTTEASVDGGNVDPSEGIGNRVEARVTRSRASGKFALKNENPDVNGLDAAGSQDVTAKRTGKRSAARGARLGWGNGLENSADGGLVVGETLSFPEEVLGEGNLGNGLETGQPREGAKVPEIKAKGRVKKARGKGKPNLSGRGHLSGSNSVIENAHTAGITIDTAQNVGGLEMQSQLDEVLITPPSAGAISVLDAQEIEAVEPAQVLESNPSGKRRSNRQKAKTGGQVEVDQLSDAVLLVQSKRKQPKKRVLNANDKPQIPVGDQQTDPEAVHLLAEQANAPEQDLNQNVGDVVEGVGPLNSLKQVRAKGRKTAKSRIGFQVRKGRKTAKAKSTGNKVSRPRGKNNLQVSDALLSSEGASRDGLVTEPVKIETPVNGGSAQEAASGKQSHVNAQNSDSSRLEEIGEAVCLDTSLNDFQAQVSVNHQADGFAMLSANEIDFAPLAGREVSSDHRTEEGVKEFAEKLESGRSLLVVEQVKILEASEKGELDAINSTVTAGVEKGLSCEAGGTIDIVAAKSEIFFAVNESCNMKSSQEEERSYVTAHDSSILKVGVERQGTVISSAEATLNAITDGILDNIVAAKKRSNGKAARGGKGGGARKGAASKKQKVDMGQGSEDVSKPKARVRKRASAKKSSNGDAPLLVTGDGVVIEAKKKANPASRRGKRKLDNETLVLSVATNQEISTVDEMESTKNAAVDGVKEPVDGNRDVMQVQEKPVKSRKNVKAKAAGVYGGATKKRRKTGKAEVPQLQSASSSIVMDVDESSRAPTGDLPSSSGSQLKAQRGKGGHKNSQEGKTVANTTPVTEKSQRPKKPPRTSKAKGATIKVLTSIKDQSTEETLQVTKNKPVRPKAGKSKSKFQTETTEQCAVADGEAGKPEKEVIESASLNPEANENHTKALQSVEVVRYIDNGAVGEDVSSGVTEGGENKGSEKGIDSTLAEIGVPRKSWVLCDDCNKWRCIPVELADQIESTNARWSCWENPDKDFQDCSVPQEKSNAEINAELQISEVSVCEEGDDKDAVDSKSMNLGAANEDNKPAVWKRIRRNIFQHRRRKVLEIDEMMVCQCTPPEDGGIGCGDNCLNRMLSIECVAEQCPCGEACSNQQFQNRTYAPIHMYRCGKKGFGLRVVEKLVKGTFIIEYVGEVLDVGAFEARQQEYARKGQKHFYFMTLNTNEVIDACSKGNFGRFINHSCEPNCRTEKWMVDGEVCIGLFAVRDIAKDEEVTFDYNYVRVCGAAAKKCECGSSQCRGFIGGDPSTPKAVLESDSEDEEDLEPVMVENSEDEDAYVDENKLAPCKKPQAEVEFQETAEFQELQEAASVRTGGIKRKLNIVKEKPRSIVKRFKISSNSVRRSNPMNYKGLTLDMGGGRHEGSRTVHFSDVQEKLDDMLDRNGGLRKKKDAAKQYLRLLVLTSASGDSRKDATACSVRDLSLLLEALLKTTSRTVLSDIMNKNGLRMLHNLIKQLRRQWDKTPILRKLIKVLELLASERVLTIDLINSSPPCHGMESFSESLFELTRHKDTEVVHMARRFRNRWMPPRSFYDHHHHRGYEKPYPMHSPSPIMQMHQPDQMNMGNRFQSPQHSKQVLMVQPPNGYDVSRPGSSEQSWSQGGNPPYATQSQNGPSCMEGTTLKEDGKSIVNLSAGGHESTPGMSEQPVKKVRKRPSRWDAPAKVEKAGEGLSHPLLSAPRISQGSMQFAAQLPSGAPNGVGPLATQLVRPFQTGNDSAKLLNGGMPGQLSSGQRASGSSGHHLQGMHPNAHIPNAPNMQMVPGPPLGPPPTHASLQQFGPPGRGFSHGPSTHMGPGVPSAPPPAPAMHGSTPPIPLGTVPAAQGYIGEQRLPPPPPMPPTAPYGHWRPPPGGPNFAGSHSFPIDPTQIGPAQTEPPVPGMSPPEPPVPGLSPVPPPPGQAPMPMSWTGPDSHGGRGVHDMAGREFYPPQWIPPQYMHPRDRNYYGSREGPWGYPGGEYWETPEGDGFREDVFALVSFRVQKHHRLRTRDLDRFCSKMADVIVRKEVAKYIEHRNQGIEKIIVKAKLVEKVDSYVDNQVELYLKKAEKSHRG